MASLPAGVAAAAMAIGVTLLKAALPPLAPIAELAILVAGGAAFYGAWMLAFARGAVVELAELVFRKRLPAQAGCSRVRLRNRGRAISEAAPDPPPTRPPKDNYHWAAGWGDN